MNKSSSRRAASGQPSELEDLKPPAESSAADSISKASTKSVGVYERPESTGGSPKAFVIGIIILIIVVTLALIFFVF